MSQIFSPEDTTVTTRGTEYDKNSALTSEFRTALTVNQAAGAKTGRYAIKGPYKGSFLLAMKAPTWWNAGVATAKMLPSIGALAHFGKSEDATVDDSTALCNRRFVATPPKRGVITCFAVVVASDNARMHIVACSPCAIAIPGDALPLVAGDLGDDFGDDPFGGDEFFETDISWGTKSSRSDSASVTSSQDSK
jgi:hypothetical protein